MKKLSLFFLLLALASLSALEAQEVKVKSFEKLERDLIARTQERLDANDEPCGVVRVTVPKAKEFQFEGNIIGEVIYSPGEAIIYMADLSNSLTIKSENYGSIKYEFPERIRKQVAYKLSLRLVLSDSQKIRTLVMPVVGIGQGNVTSYGAMIGVVRRTGFYAKVKYNFKSQSTDYECDGEGITLGSSDPAFYTGQTATSRFAITGGLIRRLARPFYLYLGGGFGYKNIAWEMSDGAWAKNTDKSYSGYEAELGGIYRLKNFSLTAGVQTNQFKYWESTLGFGIMF